MSRSHSVITAEAGSAASSGAIPSGHGPLAAPPGTRADEILNNHGTVEELTQSLPGLHVEPLWLKMTKLNPPLPAPKTTPHLWKYPSLRDTLLRAGKLVTEKQAERRVLMLINPSSEAPNTTDTLYAGLQLVMPGETAPAHRHAAFALRFIVEGEGGFTAIQGRRFEMKRADVILTPTWDYHDHGSKGSTPMIWLDGLDLPQWQHFPCHFVQHYDQARYPAEDVTTHPTLFPWSEMQARLDCQDGDWAVARYRGRPEFGGSSTGEVSKVLGAQAERLVAGGQSGPVRQETISMVYHVVDGSGSSRIGDKTFEWQKGDTFCIPSWCPYQHIASSEGPVYLYRFDDYPMISSLGFYRNATEDWYTKS